PRSIGRPGGRWARARPPSRQRRSGGAAPPPHGRGEKRSWRFAAIAIDGEMRWTSSVAANAASAVAAREPRMDHAGGAGWKDRMRRRIYSPHRTSDEHVLAERS